MQAHNHFTTGPAAYRPSLFALTTLCYFSHFQHSQSQIDMHFAIVTEGVCLQERTTAHMAGLFLRAGGLRLVRAHRTRSLMTVLEFEKPAS